jgi:isoleucyl-tRNA synthetase
MEPLDQYILARLAELTTKIRAAYDDFEFHRAYHALNEFTNTDLSALYLDVLKDRLYTFAPNHPARRSAQTALWRIAEALTRLIAPILSFTSDEVWQLLPKVEGRESSVHLALFPSIAGIVPGNVKRIETDWEHLLSVRSDVLAKLEGLRAEKTIGKSLEAIVTLNVSDHSESGARLQRYAIALPELFNVSEVEFLTVAHNDPDYLTTIAVRRSERAKCERCWRYVPDVGDDTRYPTVCLRCADALQAIDYPAYEATNERTEPQA